MRIISFDVGIKNMAYCIFSGEGERETSVIDWGILNLLYDKAPAQSTTCNCALKQPTKSKTPITVSRMCSNKAKYQKDQEYFCEKHAKASTKYLLPMNEITQSKMQKYSNPDFHNLAIKMNRLEQYTEYTKIKRTKKNTIEFFKNLLKTHCLETISKKTVSAKTTNLLDIGKSMNTQLSALLLKVDPNREITHIIIENQISPIANRMKTIQGMLAQYFIIKYEDCDIVIDFVSSFNKLKIKTQVPLQEVTPPIDSIGQTQETSTYKTHKKDGITYCKEILEQNPSMGSVADFIKHAKKDDLADSFLQGIWYLKSKNIITIADNLKINSVTQI